MFIYIYVFVSIYRVDEDGQRIMLSYDESIKRVQVVVYAVGYFTSYL